MLFPGDKERAAIAQHHDSVPIDEVTYKQVRDIAWGLDIDEPQIVRIDGGDSASATGNGKTDDTPHETTNIGETTSTTARANTPIIAQTSR